jgi:chromosome partitioning protein
LTDALEIRTEDGYQPSIIPKNQIADLDKEGENTEVFVDIGMSDMDAMKIAIQKADRVIIPIAPSQADVWSTQRFIKMIVDIRGSNMPEVLGFMNRSDTHVAVRETDEAFDALSTLKVIKMLDERLYQRTAYRRSFSEGLAVFEMNAKSKAALEVEALGKVLY